MFFRPEKRPVFQPHQQTLLPPELPLPDLPHVFQAAFLLQSHPNELLCVIHLDIRHVHSFLMGHSAEATASIVERCWGPARGSGM